MKKAICLLHDIVLGEAGHFFSILLLCIFKGIPNNFLTTRSADQFEALHYLICLLMFNSGIQIFLVFPHNDHIHDGMLGCNKRM